MKYDLEERVEKYGESIIDFAKHINVTTITKSITEQLIKAGTSIGANYFEANGASSKKDFINKIYICKKESQETKHWIRMMSISLPQTKDKLRLLWQKAQELTLIFQKITNTLNHPKV